MASTDNEVPQPIIVKKIKKGGGGHHGGAWKVAYADFVTAMMAFFLLMWLLNVTTEEQKNAISNYFDPTHPRVSSELSGSGGILGGMTMSPEGAQVSNVQDIATPATPTTPRSGMALGNQRDQMGTSEYEGDTYDPTMQGNVPSDTNMASKDDNGNDMQDGMNVLDEQRIMEKMELERLQEVIEARQNEDFEAIKQQILEEVSKSPELNDLMDHLMVDITPEGLRIQIVDKEGRSMFPIGSASMYGFMQQLVEKVTQVIIPQTNMISVRGHTDGKKYPPGAKYNNWNLSADRALASRNAMVDGGLPAERIENVIGKADREHLLPDEPLSPRNRRISIVLLRQKMENAEEIRKAAAEAVHKNKVEDAIKRREDRQDVPELDQKTQGQSNVTIQNQSPLTEAVERFEEGGELKRSGQPEIDPETGDVIGDEIQKIRDRNAVRNAPPVLPAPAPITGKAKNPIVLEFP